MSQAQRVETTFDAGAMALRYADTLSTSAGVLTPHIVADWGSAIADATGTYSEFTSGGRSFQGLLSAARFFPRGDGAFGELAGFAGGSAHSDGSRTGELAANARIHISNVQRELFFGVGAGRTWDGETWRSFAQGEVGTSFGTGPASAVFSFTPTMVNDSTKYADAQASLSWKRAKLELDAQAGLRIGRPLTTLGSDQRAWASASAVMPLASRVAIVAAGGTYPVNPTEGFPGGRFLSLSLRLMRGRKETATLPGAPSNDPPAASTLHAPAIMGLVVTRNAAGGVVMMLDAVGAETVEIAGDFTDWMPLRLTSAAAGHWTVTLPIKPGKYQMNARINGGPWVVPPGLLAMADEFGGTVGLLVVE